MRILTRLLIGLLLVTASSGAWAGDIGATFRSRLSCPYSSFAIGEVTRVDKSSITVRFTKNLLRKPAARSAVVLDFSPAFANHRLGEKLLINCWDFPRGKQNSWKAPAPFPSSFYHGKHHTYWMLARVGKDDTLEVYYPEIRGILNWLYATGNWNIRITKTETVKTAYIFHIIYPDGRKEALTFTAADYKKLEPKTK
jgi:hypothetical protein